jgi:hypothetical protein
MWSQRAGKYGQALAIEPLDHQQALCDRHIYKRPKPARAHGPSIFDEKYVCDR